jgi:pimeloyl-ACP methyl ester carboxylesterase
MIQVHKQGASGPLVIVLHGGPAAVGEAAPIARGLAGACQILEPWQRGSGSIPLSVARHIADLHEVVKACCTGCRPALVGESWGAMLALAYAAAHPDAAGPIVLIGCGSFDPESRERLHSTLEERMDSSLRQQLQRLQIEVQDAQRRLARAYELTMSLYDFDLLADAQPQQPSEPFDVQAHLETWQDMVRLQEQGVYPAAFAAIKSPVLMLHGADDPHPGKMIRDSLLPFLPQLNYHELSRCGHRPWFERYAREELFSVLREWLSRQSNETGRKNPFYSGPR